MSEGMPSPNPPPQQTKELLPGTSETGGSSKAARKGRATAQYLWAEDAPRTPIHKGLAFLVLSCVLPVWLAAGCLVFYNYKARRALTDQRTLETARALAMVVDRQFTSVESSLNALATSPSLASGDLRAFDGQARQVLQSFPGSYIHLTDASGQELLNTFHPFGTPLPKHSVPDAVRYVYETGKPNITNSFRGIFTGRLMTSVHVPVLRGERVVYDLGMNIPASVFSTVLSQQQLPPEWIGAIFDRNQIRVARTRVADEFIGRSAGPRLALTIRGSAEGTQEGINAENVPVYDSFSRSAKSGWTVVIAVPKSTMMAPIWRWMAWTTAGTALLCVIGIVFALPVARRVSRTERGLRRLSGIIESSDDAIIGYSLDGIIKTWNVGAERLYGYPAAEAIGQNVAIVLADEDREDLPRVIARVRRGESVEQPRTTGRQKNGAVVPVSLKVSPVCDESASLVGAAIIARDITNLARAEDAVRESEERFALAARATRDVIWDWDIRNDRVCFSERFSDLFGYEPSASPRTLADWAALIHPDDSAVVAFDGRDYSTAEYRMRRADGTWAHVSERKYLVRDANGQPVRKVGVLMDVTETKVAEQALRTSERLYRELFDRNLAGVFRSRTNGTLVECNTALCQMLGYESREEMYQPDALGFYYDLGEREAGFRQLLRDGHLLNYEVRLRRKDGEPITALANVAVIGGEIGEPLTLLGTVLDITELRKLQDQLLQSQKMEAVGKLAGGVAHDFNNLLMVVSSYSELLLQSKLETRQRKQLDRIMDATRRAADLTNQLLAFSRRQVISPIVLDVNAVVREMGKMLTRLIGENISLTLDLDDALDRCKVDPTQIQQMIMNLVVNARDAMPEGGTLQIRTANLLVDGHPSDLSSRPSNLRLPGSPDMEPPAPGHYVMLAVNDTGVGMDRETKARIFEPFFTTKAMGRGTGLGLSTVYGIVQQNGGFIFVDSAVGCGSSFRIYLPSAPDAAGGGEQVEKTLTVAPGGSATILLVEDEAALREAGADLLRSLGYSVFPAANGGEALGISGSYAGIIDLLLTDVIMPGMTGVELAKRISETRRDIKVLYMSGYTENSTLQDLMQHGADFYLQKPFRLQVMAEKISEVLRAGAASGQLPRTE